MEDRDPPPGTDAGDDDGSHRMGSGAHCEARSGLDRAHAALHLAPGAPLPVVRAAYRALAARHHPDVGGDPEAMRRLNAAYATLRASHRTRVRREATARWRRARAARARRHHRSWVPRRPVVRVALLPCALLLVLLALSSGMAPENADGA